MDRAPRIAEPEGTNRDGLAALAVVILALVLIGLVIGLAVI